MSAGGDPLWNWAVATYAQPDVSAQCLRLQDEHGQCVPLLLWAAWRGRHGTPPADTLCEHAAQIAHAWHDAVLVPLRATRRRLREPVTGMEDASRLDVREKLKKLELEAERALLRALATLADESPAAPPAGPDTASALRAASGAWSPDPPEQALRILADAIDARPASARPSIA